VTRLTTKSGKPVHPIGIGTWEIASRINESDLGSKYRGVAPVYGHEDAEIQALRFSLSSGQNHIDSAEMYGGFYTDEVIGSALRGLPREDLYVADKLWKTSVGLGRVRPTVKRMLDKLKTDYLDLLYIHAPWPDAPWREAITQIDELIDEGLVRQFGVSNFTIPQMEEARAGARHPIAANQVYFNVGQQDAADREFRAYCAKQDIQMVAYRPLDRQAVLDDADVREIARSIEATTAQVALAWLLEMDALPIPKAVSKAHIDENIAAIKVKLAPNDVRRLTRDA
jgi:2,5-diketo-D-gluconate reductase B